MAPKKKPAARPMVKVFGAVIKGDWESGKRSRDGCWGFRLSLGSKTYITGHDSRAAGGQFGIMLVVNSSGILSVHGIDEQEVVRRFEHQYRELLSELARLT